MTNEKKMKYVIPEVIDFTWMNTIGTCSATGSGDINCVDFGNYAIGGGSGCHDGNNANADTGSACWDGNVASNTPGTTSGCGAGNIPTPA